MIVLFRAILESFNKFCSTNNSPQEKNIAIPDWHVSNFVGQINVKIVFKNERRMIIGYFFYLWLIINVSIELISRQRLLTWFGHPKFAKGKMADENQVSKTSSSWKNKLNS